MRLYFGGASRGSSGWYPSHRTTGRRGYRGNRESVRDRSQSEKAEPRVVRTTR